MAKKKEVTEQVVRSTFKEMFVDWQDRLPSIAILVILAIAAYFRFVGLDWDEGTHLHPDERFLTMVESSLQLPNSLTDFFDTENSQFNPHNVGYGFFVYGTLPIFMVRIVGEWVGQVGYGEIQIVGRALSGVFDLISIVLIYLIGTRLYRRRVALLAALFVGLSVLLIQHAHFFVVDSIANAFLLAGIYFAVRVLDEGQLSDYLLFGLALGMSVASKINTAPVAIVIVLAALTRVLRAEKEDQQREATTAFQYLVLAAVISIVAFRIFQPYAFAGPSFFNVKLNPKWLANMNEINQLNRGNTDAPYALQWANRTPVLHSLQNLLLWGMGIPLGVVAWIGWGWAFYEIARGRWSKHLIPVVWTGGYFVWQSIGFTPAMRYQMPVYPTLALLAAWGLWNAWERADQFGERWGRLVRATAALIGVVTITLTALWAVAFTGIYRNPMTRVAASRWIYNNIPGSVNLVFDIGDDLVLEQVPMTQDFVLSTEAPYVATFRSTLDGATNRLLLPYVKAVDGNNSQVVLSIDLLDDPNSVAPLTTISYASELQAGIEQPLDLPLNQTVTLQQGFTYFLRFELKQGGPVALRGSRIVHETTWDDGMPWGVDGKSMHDRYVGLNQELYWPDEQDDNGNGVSDQQERIVQSLTEGDYLIISSKRQYGSIPRVPIRYPLSTAYYRALFDCPAPDDVLQCASVATPDTLQNDLGYELIKIFQSNPKIGPLEVNDQTAEETFTVYDHPKVFVFKKTDQYSEEFLRGILANVDLSNVVRVLPKDAGSVDSPVELTLPEDQWERQQSIGTWAEIFNLQSLINRSDILGVFVWWITAGVIGVLAFPITRVAFPGLKDWGYPLARVVGLLLMGWGTWMLGSLGIPVSRLTIFSVLLVMGVVSLVLLLIRRQQFLEYIQNHWREILWIELLAVTFFLLDLLIRLGNPDLWHPAKGGEKPMDFSYLNAVIKSETFPPYDPWFAGGYINYYYFGFVLVGMPIKLLGLEPSFAYNLVIPTLFSLLALVAYSVGYNLVAWMQPKKQKAFFTSPRFAGLAAAVTLVVLGNLGTARMFYDGLKQVGAPGGEEPGRWVAGVVDAARGLGNYLTTDQNLPYALDHWYWNPSRAITPGPGEAGPITEFPFFTFLYADLHAHMISRPLTVLAIAWALSWVLAASYKKSQLRTEIILGLFIGGLTLGALRPTNTWDFPVYWAVGILAVLYAAWVRRRSLDMKNLLTAGLAAVALLGFAQFLYQPYHSWYGQGYESARLWEGSRTPVVDYLTVHGLFLFAVIAWMIWETREWMATTPISALKRVQPYFGPIAGTALGLVVLIAWLAGQGYPVAMLAIPLMVWCGILILRPQLPEEKRIVLAMVGIGVALTFLVEVVVLEGDISRMNTVFKFYLQVWELFSIAAAAAVAWTLKDLPAWLPGWRRFWSLGLGLLVFAAALYPLSAAPAKIRDRMSQEAPHILDGLGFLPYVDNYYDMGKKVNLAEEYRAISWMQENIQGSPVIVEANIPEYRWGSRYTIYTGLPGVLGWNWHQRQQRVVTESSDVSDRALDILNFYLTKSITEANDFLAHYGVKYVIVGQLERIYFDRVQPCNPTDGGNTVSCDLRGWPWGMVAPDVHPSECEPMDANVEGGALSCPTYGLDKFGAMRSTGDLREVYRDGETVIYEVVQ